MYQSLYYCVKVGSSFSEVKQQLVGIKQGCPLSPVLFNIVFDQILTEIIQPAGFPEDNDRRGLQLLQVKHGNTGYADDVAIMTLARNRLIQLMQRAIALMQDHGFLLNEEKTKVLIMMGEDDVYNANGTLTLEEGGKTYNFEQVCSFKYLGCTFNDELLSGVSTMNQRFYDDMAGKGILKGYDPIVKNKHLPLTYKSDVIKSNVYPVLLHNAPLLGIVHKHNVKLFEANIERPLNRLTRDAIWRTSSRVNSAMSQIVQYEGLGITPPAIYVKTAAFRWVCTMLQRKYNSTLKSILFQKAGDPLGPKSHVERTRSMHQPSPLRWNANRNCAKPMGPARSDNTFSPSCTISRRCSASMYLLTT